ncbi:MAG TPA: 2-oxoglutarate dehydrogenase complex dihydrolipoyllysine-residue succinyltransferase [Armatimonadota bacterium]|nr:2-oxoglutarate dehydrogenase complex dihydrolipoyllysine-residue succinyltransferase [Armatimonadota bacterium]
MPAEIRVPVLGESVVEATVGRWLKREGEPVRAGEPLVELETDKVNVEVPADAAGVLERALAAEGAVVKPGDVLGTIDAVAASPSAPAPAAPPEAAPAAPAAPQPAPEEEVRATPLAQRVAEDLGVDIHNVPPSGPGQRVVREDVQAYTRRNGEPASTPAPASAPVRATPSPSPSAPPAAAAPGERSEIRRRLSRRRQTIARRLVEAQHTAAMLTTFNEIDLSAVRAMRAAHRDRFKEQYGVSLGFMSFFTKAAVGALKAFPEVNSELQGDELVLKQYYDIGIAIGDPEGLVVPVLRNADRMTFAEIEQKIAEYAKKAKERTLTVEELRGGTFTITNGGVFGSLLSTPILNPPQVGILGMHAIQERPVAVNGEIVIRPMMYVALSYDHRVVDGREAVQFLVRIKQLVESPELLLLEG